MRTCDCGATFPEAHGVTCERVWTAPVKLIDIGMYTQYVLGQLKMTPADNEKQLHWLRQEERQLIRESNRLVGEHPEQSTDILLTMMQRITYVRKSIESIQCAPLFA